LLLGRCSSLFLSFFIDGSSVSATTTAKKPKQNSGSGYEHPVRGFFPRVGCSSREDRIIIQFDSRVKRHQLACALPCLSSVKQRKNATSLFSSSFSSSLACLESPLRWNGQTRSNPHSGTPKTSTHSQTEGQPREARAATQCFWTEVRREKKGQYALN